MRFLPRLLLYSLPALTAFVASGAERYRVLVAAAPVDRAGQVATFSLPAGFPLTATLTDDAGHAVPLQVEADRRAQFIVPAQKAKETVQFTLGRGAIASANTGIQVVEEPSLPRDPGSAPAKGAGSVEATRLHPPPGRLRLSVQGTPALYYQMDKDALPRADIDPKYKRAGYLFPVLTPSGKSVTDDYPAQHIHHHSIWSPWTKTQFQGRSPDFWNMGTKTGTVEFAELDRTWNGPVHGGFSAWHRFVDLSAPTPVVALNETWQVTLYNAPAATALKPEAAPIRMFDLVITQTCATNDPLLLPTYIYGGLGVRGRGEWLGETKANFLTSDGETDRLKGNAARARWCHLGGDVDGKLAGTAVLGHPDNFRAPQPLRLHPKEPYLCFAPSQLGDWSIEPGKPYTARYRFIVADGAPDKALLDAYWNGYASVAEVSVHELR